MGLQADWGTDRDRRAPTIARYGMALQPRRLRKELHALEAQLGSLGAGDKRSVRLLVGHLSAIWIGTHGVSHRELVVEVALGPSTVRVDLVVEPAMPDGEDWDSLVTPAALDLVARWGLDRRRPSGAWFEVNRRNTS
jgi:hypothetical protein